jgi:hypothetical protein
MTVEVVARNARLLTVMAGAYVKNAFCLWGRMSPAAADREPATMAQ